MMELNKDMIMSMDPLMLMSILNMKLRDSYSSLENLCYDNDIECKIITDRLNEIDYIYNEESNQFISK